MASLQIDLTASGATFFDGHGANISAETEVLGLVEYSLIPETRSIRVSMKYFVSRAAKNNGGTATPIFKIDAGKLIRVEDNFSLSNLTAQQFGSAAPDAAMQFFKTRLETFFGAGSITII